MSRETPGWSEQDLQEAQARLLRRSGGVTERGCVDGTRRSSVAVREPVKCAQDARNMERSPVPNPAPSPSTKNTKYAPYKNKLEHSFATVLVLERHAGLIKSWAYESLTLKLAAGKYHRPDFVIWHNDGSIEIAQTKGYHKNMRASLTGLRWAAQKNPWFKFTIKRYKNGWESEEVSA